MKRFVISAMALTAIVMAATTSVFAQGVTTAAITGNVSDLDGRPIADVTVVALHEPSGTSYSGRSRADGRLFLPGMRVGGPYRVTATRLGYERQVHEEIFLTLGVATDVAIVMRPTAVQLEGVTVTGAAESAILSSDRTGAATSLRREALASLPTISGRLEDVARLSPQAGRDMSFAGQDNRMNNITVDGAYFNNSFGLRSTPGETTRVAPISLAAIEQIQINIAPYDVRQGNFVGAGVNTVTRSGTNQFFGSLYYAFRDQALHGEGTRRHSFDPGEFKYNMIGANLGGPIIQNRLFFFASYEGEELTQPGTTFRANPGGLEVGGNTTRVLSSDLNQLGSFLQSNFGYEAGGYEGYDHGTPATRFTGRLDFNLNDRNKFNLRYTFLDSETDVLLSNSTSLGFGNRRTSTTGLNFQNSNYIILENIRSVVGEWNSVVGGGMHNNLIIGYSSHDESRKSRGTMFPFVDVLEGGSVYTSFGFEPFTPNNELRYNSFQLQNNFTMPLGVSHSLTVGVSAERYESENVFFPGSQSVYVFNSLDDFYTDVNDHLMNPNRTESPIRLRRFQVRWSNIPGQDKPIQPLEVTYAGIYGQDEWQVNPALKVTFGLRLDAPFFGNTGFTNTEVDGMTFRDEDGNTVRYSTSKLPNSNILFSPRVGFNWDATGNRSTQVRGGTGIFTGKPAYVWISNQIGENGVLTGFEQRDDSDANPLTYRPFNPDHNHYKPTSVSGDPASSYALAFTDPDFKFPQLWRTNLAVDQRLPLGLIGTAEFLYGRDVNGIYYINANLPEAQTSFEGADDRPRWTSNRINGNVPNAIVLKNQNDGYSWNFAASVERPFRHGIFAKLAYSYGEVKNTVNPGSIASGSWTGNAISRDPNNPGLAFSASSPGHRFLAAGSLRREYFGFGATTVSVFAEARTINYASYIFSGDLNGDGGTGNDLIYIHRDISEMNFQEYTAGGTTFTAAQQAAAWEAYIQQDPYLRANRGRFAERNAVRLPMVYRADMSVVQEVFSQFFNARNSLSLTANVLNFPNLLNPKWGRGKRLVSNSPLIVPTAVQGGPVDVDGRAQYRLRSVGGQLMTHSFERTTDSEDVWRIQFGVRYNFN